MTPRLLVLALAVAAGLSACGRRGDLEQPPPLFGDRARAEYEAQRAGTAQRETTQEEGEEEDSRAPVPDPADRFEPAARNVPATSEPIEGSNDPVGPRPSQTRSQRPGGAGPR
ncbi:MAG TPA: lipoprotein [Caulobacteraceae bacterium]|jgi:predicted small lipoprotein YifL